SFALPVSAVADIDTYIARLKSIADEFDVLRIKGFVDVTNKPMRLLVQGVGTRFRHQFDKPWATGAARQGHLVFIAEKGIDRAAIEAALAKPF
ncbi:MAG: cobalamin biosynthesis protein CobW, partial [Alphaproteobacteria bacterium]|nr:cobalamin biosynthesis protein CobW [Alphaproteobacteria bacterium]